MHFVCVDDYRLTACISLLKRYVACYQDATSGKMSPTPSLKDKRRRLSVGSISPTPNTVAEHESESKMDSSTNKIRSLSIDSLKSVSLVGGGDKTSTMGSVVSLRNERAIPRGKRISIKWVNFAIDRCELFLGEIEHKDIDDTLIDVSH